MERGVLRPRVNEKDYNQPVGGQEMQPLGQIYYSIKKLNNSTCYLAHKLYNKGCKQMKGLQNE